MRGAVLKIGLMAAGIAVTGAALPADAAPATPSRAAGSSSAPVDRVVTGAHGERIVEYGGLRLPVPAGWRIRRLDRKPGVCVRFDVKAVYIGLPKGEQNCPAKVVGRTEAVHLTPVPTVVDPGQRRTRARRSLSALRVASTTSHDVTVTLPEAGVRITGTYGRDRAALQRLLNSGSVGFGTTQQADPPKQVKQKRRAWEAGPGFDTCAAPTTKTMAAWREAYAIANIYIGGAARGCAQLNLSASWVKTVRAQGYRLIPTYVGLQAPCTRYYSRIKPKYAKLQGRQSATDAVKQAKALGIPKKKALYFDMENYDSADKSCKNAVLNFLHAWTKRLHKLGYKSGVYSSAGSGIRDVGRATGIRKPDAIWFAHWDGKAATKGSPYLPDSWWPKHRRIKQYRGGHYEKHGGVRLHVDSNIVDSLVY